MFGNKIPPPGYMLNREGEFIAQRAEADLDELERRFSRIDLQPFLSDELKDMWITGTKKSLATWRADLRDAAKKNSPLEVRQALLWCRHLTKLLRQAGVNVRETKLP